MWYILLDQSGSMGLPFNPDGGEPDLLSNRSSHIRKFDAAIEALRVRLARLSPDANIALLTFTTKVRLVYRGTASNADGFRRALAGLEPDNGTDIAAALEESLRLKRAADDPVAGSGDTYNQILIITDGISDLAAARRAAQRCAEERIVIHVILIDPTVHGEQLALEITEPSGGLWEKVFGPEDLEAAIEHARLEAAQSEAANTLQARSAKESKVFASEIGDRERLQFTAVHPQEILANTTDYLAVFVHLGYMRLELETQIQAAQAFFSGEVIRNDAEAQATIMRGTIITLRPELPGMIVTPQSQAVRWSNKLVERWFEIRPSSSAASLINGSVKIQIGGLTVGTIPMAIRTKSVDSTPRRATALGAGRMFGDVFASYASEDSAVVERCRASYHTLGIRLIVDKSNILVGQRWREVIGKWIEGSDAFQLYWSDASRDSDEVQIEVQHAVSVAKTRPSISEYILPVYWSDSPPQPIPGPLAGLHFVELPPHMSGGEPDSKNGPPGWIGMFIDAFRSWLYARRGRSINGPLPDDDDGVKPWEL